MFRTDKPSSKQCHPLRDPSELHHQTKKNVRPFLKTSKIPKECLRTRNNGSLRASKTNTPSAASTLAKLTQMMFKSSRGETPRDNPNTSLQQPLHFDQPLAVQRKCTGKSMMYNSLGRATGGSRASEKTSVSLNHDLPQRRETVAPTNGPAPSRAENTHMRMPVKALKQKA